MAITDAVKNSPEFASIYGKILGNTGPGVNWDAKTTWDTLGTLQNEFSNLFQNSVGRAPTDAEVQKMYGELGPTLFNAPQGFSAVRNDPQWLRQNLSQYIGDTFQQAAQDTATQKANDLTSQYSSLADQYLAMGKKSLGNLSDDLKSYSTSLFDKLRPQLNLAAQAGGYADSGGQTLQEQGALKDLATQGEGVLAQANYDVENNANNIRYGGAAAPVSMASSFAANAPYAVQSLGSGGTNFLNTNTMSNYDYLRKLGLMDAQGRITERTSENMAPSFGRTLSQSFANQLGGNLADVGSQGIQGALSKFGVPGLG